MAVGAKRHKICFRVDGFFASEVRNRYNVVNVNEAFRVVTISLFKIETTRFAAQSMDCNSLHAQVFATLIAGSEVACLAAFVRGYECQRIILYIR